MSVLRFLKDYLRISTLLSIPLILAILLITRFQGDKGTSPPVIGEGQPPSKMTVSDFQENRTYFIEKYPALLKHENNVNMSDENAVKILNDAMDLAAEYWNEEGEAPKSQEELLDYVNAVVEKTKDINWPTYIQELNGRIQEVNKFIDGREERKAELEAFKAQVDEDYIFALSLLERLDILQKDMQQLDDQAKTALQNIASLKESPAAEPSEDTTFFNEVETIEYPQSLLEREAPLNENAPAELKFLSHPQALTFLIEPEMSASALPWYNLLTTSLGKWERDFFDQYPNALSATLFTVEEFTEVFPTEKDLQLLRDEQNEMLVDVTQRVRKLIESNTPGSREEKLSITRNILSQYWGNNFADHVMGELQ